jgi:hypothetical protein
MLEVVLCYANPMPMLLLACWFVGVLRLCEQVMINKQSQCYFEVANWKILKKYQVAEIKNSQNTNK